MVNITGDSRSLKYILDMGDKKKKKPDAIDKFLDNNWVRGIIVVCLAYAGMHFFG